MTVLADTSALYALVDSETERHDAALAAFPDLARDAELVVHNYAIVEATALVQRRFGMEAVRFLHQELLPAITTRWIDQDTHAAALIALLAADKRRVSFVDRVSFEVMRRDRIDAAFAFDADFAAQGFRTVPAAV